ncbi:hypothetical protein [uncultured Alsobacter sp.]|uniref:hypothetical protein n=1 Tax=uncultured Alsobacter sp. TaxID=1748258 RepID=UPI0025F98ABE|nr:hypothetical protein [uncultured Alsobacter sp.]
MTAISRRPLGPLVIMIAGAAGVLLSAYAYLTPLTGITGAPGALLVIGSSVALVVDGLILRTATRGAVFWLFWLLGVLGAIGTLSAGYFLHAWWLMAAILIVLVGLGLTLTTRRRTVGDVA